jgi:hypothetical protein
LTRQLRLHTARPTSTRRPGAEKRIASSEGDIMVETNFHSYTFRKGMMSETPLSLVQEMDWVFTHGRRARGEHNALNRESGSRGLHRRQGFHPRCPPAQSRAKMPDLSRCHRCCCCPVIPQKAPSKKHQRAGCTQQPHSCVGHHTIRPGNTPTRLHLPCT